MYLQAKDKYLKEARRNSTDIQYENQKNDVEIWQRKFQMNFPEISS